MPRNLLKSFPTAMLRRGLAHVHPICMTPVAPGPRADLEPARIEIVPFDLAPDPPMTLLLIVPDLPPSAAPVEDEATLVAA